MKSICILLLTFTLVCAGCATTQGDGADASETPREAASVTLEIEQAPAGEVVRQLGQDYGGGIVLMNGLEMRPVSDLSVDGARYEEAVAAIAEACGATYSGIPYRYFIYPQGYEVLLQQPQIAALPETYDAEIERYAVAHGVKLYNALALLSHGAGATFVADQWIAEEAAGETSMAEAPLRAVLGALLQGARIVPDAVEVETGPGYCFLFSPLAQHARQPLLNADALDAEAQAWLGETVSATLPRALAPGDAFPLPRTAFALSGVLPSLEAQLDGELSADAAAADLPVNPAAYRNISRRKLLDLLVRQWLSADFGYEVQGTRVHFRQR